MVLHFYILNVLPEKLITHLIKKVKALYTENCRTLMKLKTKQINEKVFPAQGL